MTRATDLHEMAGAERGMISVRTRERDPKTGMAFGIDAARKPKEIPVGQELIDAAWRMNGNDKLRMSESTAVVRYLSSQGVDIRDVLDEFLVGQDIGHVTVARFLTNTGMRPLFSPVVEDGLRLGMNRIAAQWSNLVARQIPVDAMTYEYYFFDNGSGSNLAQPVTGRETFKLMRVAQGAPIPVAKVTVSGKSYTLYKKGRGIEWSDEAKSAPIDLAQLWFQQVGIDIGWGYHDEVIDVLLNGYFADNSDDPIVINTAVAATITDADLYTAQATHQLAYGYIPDAMLASIATSVAIQTMENGAGQRLFPNGVQAAGLPALTMADAIPADKVLFVDTGFACIRLVNKEFGTEFARVPQNQMEGSYGTSIDLFVPFMAAARLVLDS